MDTINQIDPSKRRSGRTNRPVRSRISLAAVIFAAFAINVASVSTAFAYIDPGTGTMVLQVLGALFASALFWMRNIRLWVAGKLGFERSSELTDDHKDVRAMKDDGPDDE